MIRLTSAIFFTMLVACHPVAAQVSGDEEKVMLTADIICGLHREKMEAVPEKYGEVPFATGRVQIRSANVKEYMEADMWMYVNPEDGNFTMLTVIDGDPYTCMFVNGKDFRPWTDGVKSEGM